MVAAAAIVLAACAADKANPVLPSTGNSGGWVAGAVLDGSASAGKPDAAQLADTFTRADADASDADRPNATCDLLKQDCAAASDGCYPVAGVGRCQPAGSAGVLASCGFGEPAPPCDRGLACIQTSDMRGVCLHLCSVEDPVPFCGLGNVCRPLPGFRTVGYCQQA